MAGTLEVTQASLLLSNPLFILGLSVIYMSYGPQTIAKLSWVTNHQLTVSSDSHRLSS